MNATLNQTLAGVIAGVIILGAAIAISSTPAFARDLPGGAREPSPAGNVQGVQGGGGCRGAACNVKGPNPAGVKNVPKRTKPLCREPGTRGGYGGGRGPGLPLCGSGVGGPGGGNKGTKCQPNGEGCLKKF